MTDLPTRLRALAEPERVGDARRAVMREAADVIDTLRQDRATLEQQLDAARSSLDSLHHDYEFIALDLGRLDRQGRKLRNLFAGMTAFLMIFVASYAMRYMGWLP